MFIGEMGAIKASLATDRFISKWNPQTIIMLGIAASLSDDASVGDVIVASQVDAYLENAKAVPAANQDGYTFKLSGEVYRSSADLLQSVRNFEFAHRKLFLAWQQQCKDELERLLSQDHLETSLASGLLCSHVKLIDGHVASGPAVGATRTFTDWLKERDRKYLALEMEAAGLMAAVYEHANPKKTMVIRAISDYGDERKTELDKKGEGIFRRYAIRNSIQLLLSFLDTGLFPQT